MSPSVNVLGSSRYRPVEPLEATTEPQPFISKRPLVCDPDTKTGARGRQAGSARGLMVEFPSITGRQVSVTSFKLSCPSAGVATDVPEQTGLAVPIKLYLQVQLADQAWPLTWDLWIPALA